VDKIKEKLLAEKRVNGRPRSWRCWLFTEQEQFECRSRKGTSHGDRSKKWEQEQALLENDLKNEGNIPVEQFSAYWDSKAGALKRSLGHVCGITVLQDLHDRLVPSFKAFHRV
jgi:hypothetical protein